jgi:orotidine-5'-phosphate decarboxylase
MNDARSRLIVALDVPDRKTALDTIRRLDGRAGLVKVGLQLFVAEGPQLVREIRAMGQDVFLDLKLHDIPNTVAGAVRSACRLGVQMLTLHTSGGKSMMEAALKAAAESETPPLLLGVTALTSLSTEDCGAIGIGEDPSQWVERLARLAQSAGLRGLVTSPLEAPALRRALGGSPLLVVPGIRGAGVSSQDQARTASAAQAVRAGADYIVVGRPILQAADPAAAADAIIDEVAQALAAAKS